MLLVILLAHRIDILLELNNIAMGGAIYFYLANELISIPKIWARSAFRCRIVCAS